jgi:hypothetical protein
VCGAWLIAPMLPFCGVGFWGCSMVSVWLLARGSQGSTGILMPPETHAPGSGDWDMELGYSKANGIVPGRIRCRGIQSSHVG